MYPVLFIVILAVGIVVVNVRRRSKERVVQSRQDARLDELAPVVAGTVSADRVLHGTYGGYAVEASLAETWVESVGSSSGHAEPIPVVRLHLLGVPGTHPWSCRARLRPLLGNEHEFGFSDGDHGLAAGVMRRLGQLPEPDPDLPDRLRDAGLIDAIRALDRPTNVGWVPHVQFRPDLAPVMVERMRQRGITIPDDARAEAEKMQSMLEVEVERHGDDDPSPDEFRALLDGAIHIAEINGRVNTRSA
jgi:hypothetical protein